MFPRPQTCKRVYRHRLLNPMFGMMELSILCGTFEVAFGLDSGPQKGMSTPGMCTLFIISYCYVHPYLGNSLQIQVQGLHLCSPHFDLPGE